MVRSKIGRSLCLCRIQVMLMMTNNFCVGRILRDGWTRESLHQKMLDLYRDEDARDLRRCVLNELVESMPCLNALQGWIWKCEKSCKHEKSNQNIVMTEEFVKNSVMNATIDPKIVMDLSIFKIGGWKIYSRATTIFWKNLLMRLNRGC